MWYSRLFLFVAAGVLSVAWAQGGRVQSLGPFGGDVRSLAVHSAKPERLFLGTSDGQIYLSHDSGENWKKLMPGLRLRDVVVDNLVFDPKDSETLYAGCWALKNNRGWLFRTSDGGETWKNLPLGQYASQVRAIAVSPTDSTHVAIGIAEGVLLSTDSGQTWERISRGYRSLHNVESLAFDPVDSQTLYVGTWRLGWKTENLGKKWQPIHNGMPFDSDMFSLMVNPRETNVLFASACTGVFRSSDAGLNWVKLRNGLPAEAKRTRTLHMDPSDPETVYAGTTIGLYVSRDSGMSWTLLAGDLVVNAIAVQPSNPDIIVVGTDDAGVLKSEDAGQSFAASNNGFVHRQISAIEHHRTDPSRLFTVVAADGLHGGVFVSSNQGREWASFNSGLDPVISSINRLRASSRSEEVFLGTNRGVFRGVPGKQDWKVVPSTAKLRVVDLDFTNSEETALSLATPSGLFRLDLRTGKALKWTIPVYEGPIHGILWDVESDGLFASTDMGVFKSQSGTGPWKIKVIGLPPIRVNQVSRGGQRLFCGTTQGIYFSDNNAESWTPAKSSPGFNITQIRSNPKDPSRVYSLDSTSSFLFESQDGGDSWSEVSTAGLSRISGLAFTPSGQLLAGSLSEGVYLLDDFVPSTDSGEDQAN